MAVRRLPAESSPPGLPPPRSWKDLPSDRWLREDRQDEIGESQFAVAGSWMNDPSLWDDVYEDNLAKGVRMQSPPKRQNHQGKASVILDALAEGPRRACDLRELSGLNGYFSQFMKKLRDDGIVVMPKRGTYALPNLPAVLDDAQADEQLDEVDAGAELAIVEADWTLRLRIIAEYEKCSVSEFVDRLLASYSEVRNEVQ